MTKASGAMRWGAVFVGISAGLHVLALFVSGFSSEAMRLLPVALVYAVLAYGVLRGWRLLAYAVFLVMLIGTSFAVLGIWASGDVPQWIYSSIAASNILAAAALFAALWKAPEAST
ncbi:hypothetical protein QTO30_12060 [Yoonia sp. GPGPB17]|uniref:hypothetical protein n=1 Tax=Yoonia sp. GPGPB17 TaxID=3026147 RepID=UPI0030C49D20